MLPGLKSVTEQVRQRRDRDAREMRRACPGPLCSEEILGLAFKPGDRVVDLVTGLEGEILAGDKTSTLISASAAAVRERVRRSAR